METNNNNGNDILELKAFSEPIQLNGVTYYDTHSRMFNIIRMPAIIRHLFPQVKKNKLKFEILCFPDNQKLKEYLDTSEKIPLVLNLFERKEDD